LLCQQKRILELLTLSFLSVHYYAMISRINNPDKVTEKSVLSAKGTWGLPTIQFSKSGQSKGLLKSINALCKVFGAKLPVRFYGHYENGFDATVLKHLPDVQWLLIDCLQDMSNSENVFQLPKLKKLSFGVYNYENSEFLSQLNLQKLEQLTIGETKKRNIDLALLAKAKKMRSLSIVGHSTNIVEVRHMQSLEELSLNLIGKKNSVEFISKIANLKTLKIILGGRQNIDEVSHPVLEELEIIRVRGLNNIGELSRFPCLKRLQIEDQIQLKSIELASPKLEDLKILNCKNFNQIEGLSSLKKLKQLRCSRTALDYAELTEFSWPESMETLALYSGNKKQDEIIRKRLDMKGFKEFP